MGTLHEENVDIPVKIAFDNAQRRSRFNVIKGCVFTATIPESSKMQIR